VLRFVHTGRVAVRYVQHNATHWTRYIRYIRCTLTSAASCGILWHVAAKTTRHTSSRHRTARRRNRTRLVWTRLYRQLPAAYVYACACAWQVTCEYRMEKGACVPVRVHTVVISIQHSDDVTTQQLRKDLMDKVVTAVIPRQYIDSQTVFHLQPSGRFVIGGPQVTVILSHTW